MASASLVVRVRAQIAEFQKSFAEASDVAKKFAGDFEGIATRAAAVGTFIGNIAADIAKSIASGLGSAIKDAVRLSSEFANAFTGLSSVAAAFGTDANSAKEAARRLSSDGLLPVKDAATGLKNLLATGFSLPEATQLMNAFKDSAAFGRAGALSFGDAIRTATEGVKNGNSILVDNAGITKNLSQILKEAGFSAQDLSKASSDAAVRQALFNGILRESAAFAGDAQRATQTYSGQVSRLGTAYDTLLVSLGNAVTQNATVGRALGFVGDQLNRLTTGLTTNKRGFDLVSSAVILLVRTFDQALNVVDLIQTGFAGLQRTFNRVAIDILNVGIAIAKFGERSESVMRFLDPSNWKAHSQNIADARSAYESLDGMVKKLEQSSKLASDRSIEWGNALQENRAVIRTLANDLESTRGKTIEFGDSAKQVGKAVGESFATGASKAVRAIRTLETELKSARITTGLRSEVGIPINPKLAFPSEIAIQQTIQSGLSRIASGMRGVRLDIDTEVALPNVTLPQTFWQQVFKPTDVGGALGTSILSAVQGGGNVFASAAGAVGTHFTTGLAKYLTGAAADGGKAIGGFLGGAINAVLPGLGALLGPLVGKITQKLTEAFGGPSKEELLGRDVVGKFEQQLAGMVSIADKISAGNESWKITTIAVRDAYLAAGLTVRDAELAVSKLWASSRSGSKAAELAVLEIQAVIEQAAKRQRELSSDAKDAAFDIEHAINNIRIEPIEVPFTIRARDVDLGLDVPAMASGGIVRRPTLALIGEAGPEAVVPLSSRRGVVAGGSSTNRQLAAILRELQQQPDTWFRAVRGAKALST